MKNSKLFWQGFFNSLGVVAYVFLLSLFMSRAQEIFKANNELLAPMAFILLFVFSALISGFLVLGKPIMLYLNDAKKQSVKLLFYTGITLFFWMIIAFIILLLI